MTPTPGKADFLFDRIDQFPPKQVLEVGAGTSIAILAAAARRYGFKVLLLENHEGTIDYVDSLIGDLDCSERVTVQECGLRRFQTTQRRRYIWYKANLTSLQSPIDWLLIDGPMESLMGRNGALHSVLPFVNAEHRIYLDDCKRKHEKACVSEW